MVLYAHFIQHIIWCMIAMLNTMGVHLFNGLVKPYRVRSGGG